MRQILLRTTAIVSIVASLDAMFTPSSRAADAIAPWSAVDGINGKLESLVGTLGPDNIYGARGALSVPLTGQWGTQVDFAGGWLEGLGFGSIGDHTFWRNPQLGLLGIYGNYTEWAKFGGAEVGQVAAEGQLYLSRWTIEGIAGVEAGNSVSRTTLLPGVISTTGIDVRTRFTDQANLKYYLTDNWDGYVGHTYLGGQNAFALGTEAAVRFGGGTMGSLFVEAEFSKYSSVWGGFRFYFGQKDKTLLARHREDDPPLWYSLQSILNSQFTSSSGTGSGSGSGGGVTGSSSFLVRRPPSRRRRRTRRSMLYCDFSAGRDIGIGSPHPRDRLATGVAEFEAAPIGAPGV
jgi:hypothetical protein